MSTKRAKAREWKRKRQQTRSMMIVGGIAALLLILAGIAYVALDTYNRSYVMTFDGKKISVEDFRFMRLFATSEENAKTEAMTQLTTYLVIDKAATENGVVMNEEDQAAIDTNVSGFKGYFEAYEMAMPKITDARFAEFMSMDIKYGKLRDIYTADYTIDEQDFETALADYKENDAVDYVDTQVKYLFTDVLEDAQAGLAAVKEGSMDIDSAIAQYSMYYDEEAGVSTVAMKSLGLEAEMAAEIMALGAGGISELVDLDGEYGFFYVDSVTVPTDEEIYESYREIYINDKKAEIFGNLVNEWTDSADIVVNQHAYDKAW